MTELLTLLADFGPPGGIDSKVAVWWVVVWTVVLGGMLYGSLYYPAWVKLDTESEEH